MMASTSMDTSYPNSQAENQPYTTSLLGGNLPRRNNNPQFSTKFNDSVFAGLFLINTIIVFSLALVYGVVSLSAIAPRVVTINDSGFHYMAPDDNITGEYIGGIFVVSIIAGLLSMLMIFLLSKFSENIIVSSLLATIVVCLGTGIGMLYGGLLVGGLLVLCFAIFIGIFLYQIRKRIGFASINMRIACEAISSMPKIYAYAAAVMGIEFLWCTLWGMAVYGVSTKSADGTIHYEDNTFTLNECTTFIYSGSAELHNVELECSYGSCQACFCEDTLVSYSACYSERFYSGYYILMMISLLWACSVFSNVLHCTTAGAVCRWWRSRPEEFDPVAAATNSFLTTILNDFGSICLGSLFVALLKGLRSFLDSNIKQLKEYNQNHGGSNNPLVCIASTLGLYLAVLLAQILKLVDFALEYFNRYAFTYVALYGYNFTNASKAVVVLFRGRGWDAIINDEIVDSVMFVWNITIGVMTMAFGLIFGHWVGMSIVDDLVFAAVSFSIGCAIGLIALKIVMAGVAAIYVMFAEYPELFEQCHPSMYYELMQAWEELYPTAMQKPAGGMESGETLIPPQSVGSTGLQSVITTGGELLSNLKWPSTEYSTLPQDEPRTPQTESQKSSLIPTWARSYLSVLTGGNISSQSPQQPVTLATPQQDDSDYGMGFSL